MEHHLQHYGIKGMRWGVQRTAVQLASSQKKNKGKSSLKKTSIKNMSDEELQKSINRLQMEKQYSQLSKSKIDKGQQYAKNILAAELGIAAATTAAITIYNNSEKIAAIFEKMAN